MAGRKRVDADQGNDGSASRFAALIAQRAADARSQLSKAIYANSAVDYNASLGILLGLNFATFVYWREHLIGKIGERDFNEKCGVVTETIPEFKPNTGAEK